MLAALKAAGAPQEVLDACRPAASSPSEDIEIWPENVESVEAFLDLATCWSWLCAGFSQPTRVGIPASEIHATLSLRGVRRKARKAIASDIRLMENAALAQLSGQ